MNPLSLKGILLIISMASATGSQPPACPNITLPSSFTMKEQVFSWTTTLDITGPQSQSEGQVVKKFFSWGTEFDYTNANNQYSGQGHAVVFSWGNQINVNDCNGNLVGGIKENILKSLSGIETVYTLTDGSGNDIGVSDKLEAITTDFTIKDNGGNTVATLHRPFLNVAGDTWTVNVVNTSVVDPLTLVMIGAFKTDADNAAPTVSSINNLIATLAAQGILCGAYYF